MDSSRFDEWTRTFAQGTSRRRFLTGVGAALVGVVGARRAAEAGCPAGQTPCNKAGVGTICVSCPPGRILGSGCRCLCRLTGREPVNGICPCPAGQVDTGDGQGCHCTPDCTGKLCGADDGCGRRCQTGTCPEQFDCKNGVCVTEPKQPQTP